MLRWLIKISPNTSPIARPSIMRIMLKYFTKNCFMDSYAVMLLAYNKKKITARGLPHLMLKRKIII